MHPNLGSIDGKFRHFEHDAEYKLQLNLNHGLKFPLTNGSLYGRLHNHQNRGVPLFTFLQPTMTSIISFKFKEKKRKEKKKSLGSNEFSSSFTARTGTITMGIQHYPRSQSTNEENAYGSLPPEMASFTSSTFEPRIDPSTKTSFEQRIREHENFEFGKRRKIGSTDVFGQNLENLVQLDDPSKRKFTKSLDEIREEVPRRIDRSVPGLENLVAGLEKNRSEEIQFQRNAVRRNQSFDHVRYVADF